MYRLRKYLIRLLYDFWSLDVGRVVPLPAFALCTTLGFGFGYPNVLAVAETFVGLYRFNHGPMVPLVL